jgi:hypothetical protein
MIGAEE